ncbi:hypothetical protein E4U21_007790 [Claviceps maximensis]|nr:hypothetical protein E4U21_007790 [Claviceps maximensis]
MGKDSVKHKKKSSGRFHATAQQMAEQQRQQQQQAQHEAEFDQQLRHLQSHYQDGRYALFPDAAQGRRSLEVRQLADSQHQQMLQQQLSRVQQSTPASRPPAPDFLDTLSYYTHVRGEQQQQAWLDRYGLRGTDPREQSMYPHLPARMRQGYERRREAKERTAQETERMRLEGAAAMEYERRHHNLTYFSNLALREQEWPFETGDEERGRR